MLFYTVDIIAHTLTMSCNHKAATHLLVCPKPALMHTSADHRPLLAWTHRLRRRRRCCYPVYIKVFVCMYMYASI